MKREENQTVEYKESWHEKYLEWICGYANAKGGTLYIGIEDGTTKPVGVKNPNKLMEDIPNSIRNTMGIVAGALRSRHGRPCRRGQPRGLRRPRVPRDPRARRAERREEPARPRPPPRVAGQAFDIMSASTTLQRRPTMDTILVKVRLPCSAARLENALLKAAHNGHWHDAQVKVDEKGNLIVTYPDDSK